MGAITKGWSPESAIRAILLAHGWSCSVEDGILWWVARDDDPDSVGMTTEEAIWEQVDRTQRNVGCCR